MICKYFLPGCKPAFNIENNTVLYFIYRSHLPHLILSLEKTCQGGENTFYLDFAGEENKTEESDIVSVTQLLTDTYGSVSGPAVFLTTRNSISRMKPQEEENFVLLLFPEVAAELYSAHGSHSDDRGLSPSLFSQ